MNSSGYGQHFNKLRSQKGLASSDDVIKAPTTQTIKQPSSDEVSAIIKNGLREDLEIKRKKIKARMNRGKSKRRFPWLGAFSSLLGLILAGAAFYEPELFETLQIPRLKIEFLDQAFAEKSEPKKDEGTKKVESPSETVPNKSAEAKSDSKEKSDEKIEVSHLTNLVDRKKELDLREQEINRLSEELKAKEAALDQRINQLEKMRKEISDVLAERVERDAQRIDSLVQVYSTMKPAQAAKVFEEMDQDLAIQILGKMKKKNAAEIMNLLPSAKAKLFSEKYAGYINDPN